jgi:hypothetical protein
VNFSSPDVDSKDMSRKKMNLMKVEMRKKKSMEWRRRKNSEKFPVMSSGGS